MLWIATVKQVPINEKENKRQSIYMSWNQLCYCLTCSLSHTDVTRINIIFILSLHQLGIRCFHIGRGQGFQLLKSSWAVFYTGREFASCCQTALHNAVVITAWHTLVSSRSRSPAFLQPLPGTYHPLPVPTASTLQIHSETLLGT